MSSNDVIGKTIERVDYDYDHALCLHFTDGTMLYARGIWHNDSTAGISASLLKADQPKSYEESEGFYTLAFNQRWDNP